MRPRTSAVAVIAVLAVAFALVPVRAEQIHRHQFGGKKTVLVRGDANVRVDEDTHDISNVSFKSQPSSEHLKLVCEAATGDAAFVHYYYDTPPAPVSEILSAGVWVKATKPGIELRARVVFPKEPDPANPQAALTMLVIGTAYPAEKSRQWHKLTLENVPELLGKHLPVLQAKTGRAVNTSGAYIDRIVLNLYTGPGTAEIWVDDLDIGPVKPPLRPDAAGPGAPGVPVKLQRPGERQPGGRQIEQRGATVRGRQAVLFPRDPAHRHTAARPATGRVRHGLVSTGDRRRPAGGCAPRGLARGAVGAAGGRAHRRGRDRRGRPTGRRPEPGDPQVRGDRRAVLGTRRRPDARPGGARLADVRIDPRAGPAAAARRRSLGRVQRVLAIPRRGRRAPLALVHQPRHGEVPRLARAAAATHGRPRDLLDVDSEPPARLVCRGRAPPEARGSVHRPIGPHRSRCA